jgi:hypothetical protein
MQLTSVLQAPTLRISTYEAVIPTAFRDFPWPLFATAGIINILK